ncbi:MAG: hypothetical protein AAGI01_08790 [Myxococcota bacterium]
MTLPVKLALQPTDSFTTDLGYTVRIDRAQIAARDLTFTIADETHTVSLLHLMSHALIPSAHAHPGHGESGEITGELLGLYVMDWFGQGGELGSATLLAGTYASANFTFARAAADTPGADDVLAGHTAVLSGVASTRGAPPITFTFVIDSPEDRELLGIPFDAEIEESSAGSLSLSLEPVDPFEGDTLMDGIDFIKLDQDADGVVLVEPNDPDTEGAYNVFRRILQTHDHYIFQYQE